MIIEVMCRIADGPLRPGELEVRQVVAPLVNWSLNTHDGLDDWDEEGDLAVELRLPDNTVWTGEVYPMPHADADDPQVELRGIGPLKENSVPIHADVVLKRLEALPSAES